MRVFVSVRVCVCICVCVWVGVCVYLCGCVRVCVYTCCVFVFLCERYIVVFITSMVSETPLSSYFIAKPHLGSSS